MPILAVESSVYPSDLLDDSEFSEISTGPYNENATWWLFYTRARQEKSLARDLRQREIRFYLPLVRRRLLIRGRPLQSHIPLFTGYLFVQATPEERVRALITNRVAQVLEVKDAEQLHRDLVRIQRLIEADAPLTVESRFEPNQRVRVRSGPLLGLEGTIARRKNATRLVIWVTMLQQGVSIEVEDYLLEPIS